eukprot:403333992
MNQFMLHRTQAYGQNDNIQKQLINDTTKIAKQQQQKVHGKLYKFDKTSFLENEATSLLDISVREKTRNKSLDRTDILFMNKRLKRRNFAQLPKAIIEKQSDFNKLEKLSKIQHDFQQDEVENIKYESLNKKSFDNTQQRLIKTQEGSQRQQVAYSQKISQNNNGILPQLERIAVSQNNKRFNLNKQDFQRNIQGGLVKKTQHAIREETIEKQTNSKQSSSFQTIEIKKIKACINFPQQRFLSNQRRQSLMSQTDVDKAVSKNITPKKESEKQTSNIFFQSLHNSSIRTQSVIPQRDSQIKDLNPLSTKLTNLYEKEQQSIKSNKSSQLSELVKMQRYNTQNTNINVQQNTSKNNNIQTNSLKRDSVGSIDTLRKFNSLKIHEKTEKQSSADLSQSSDQNLLNPLQSTQNILNAYSTQQNFNSNNNIKSKTLRQLSQQNQNIESPNKAQNRDKVQRTKQIETLLSNKQRIQLNKIGFNNKEAKPREIIRQYLKRNNQKNAEDQLVVMIKSNENHIKREVQRRGWMDNLITSSNMYDIKFEIQDQQSDYTNLKPYQLFNHFPNNTEVTTKSGLMKNLYQNSSQNFNVDKFFPRSYDLSDVRQSDEFLLDFQQTSIFTYMKKLYNFFKTQLGIQMSDIYQEISSLKKGYNYREIKSNLVLKYLQMIPDDEKFILNIKLTEKALTYCKKFIKNKTFNDLVKSDLIGQLKIDPDDIVTEKTKRAIQRLSKFDPPYLNNQDLIKIHNDQFSIDGLNNIWIVKPSYNARGLGIYCVNDASEVTQNGQRKVQSKVIQKYIEKPCLLELQNSQDPTKTELRKFDIRIWVLVTSFDPLQIYVFSDYYLRICGSEFSLDDIQDNYKHLSNYTIQKNNQRVENKDEDLTMSMGQSQIQPMAFGSQSEPCLLRKD